MACATRRLHSQGKPAIESIKQVTEAKATL